MNELFLKAINMSISTSWLILAVLILRLVLKKAPRWVNVLLWGIVAVRLICPFSVESTLSLIPSAETIPMNIETAATPAIDSGINVVNNVINPVIFASFTPHPAASTNPLQIWIPLASVLWISGMVVLLLYAAISYWRLRRKVDTAVQLRDNIFQSENVSSPFVLGIIRSRIYLPFKMAEQDLEHVVAHEQAHICRRDHWWKPLGFFLLTIHWFNPLMWLAYMLLCRDIELACDEKVIRDLGSEQRADYTRALVAYSINRRMIAACPLAFGEVGVKERVRSVMNYKRPAFWIIILAVAACMVAAVCFLTNPLGFQFNEASNAIVSASCFDMRTVDDAESVELNSAQLSELSSRLAGVRNTKSGDIYAGLTPGYQISALLQDGTYIRISGYSLSDTDKVDIEWDGDRYVVADGDFQEYLSRICAGGDISSAVNITDDPDHPVTKWFDYLDVPEEMSWDGRLEINIPELPDVTFRWYPEKMEAITENEIIPLYSGMPIWSAYFCDLTGDGIPEICSSLSVGSGMIDDHIVICDYANGASYTLADRGSYDYTLRLNDSDGRLYVDKKVCSSNELLSSGRLAFEDDCIQIVQVKTNAIEMTSEQGQLMDKYPEYFGLDASNGLDIYVWQLAENNYSFGLLPHTAARRDWLSSELLNLQGTDADEMRQILAAYNIDENNINIIPWQNPISSYLGEHWIISEGESIEEKQKDYIESVRNMLFNTDS